MTGDKFLPDDGEERPEKAGTGFHYFKVTWCP